MSTQHYYASPCPESGRWFVCRYGMDNNVCEAFEHEGRTARENAWRIVQALTSLETPEIDYDRFAWGAP